MFPSSIPFKEVLSLLEQRDSQAAFTSIFAELLELVPGVAVIEDRSPVMRSQASFLARVDHSGQTITLNGCYLDQIVDFRREKVRNFLIFHELFHVWARRSAQPSWKRTIDSDEERAADALGLYAVCLAANHREASRAVRGLQLSMDLAVAGLHRKSPLRSVGQSA